MFFSSVVIIRYVVARKRNDGRHEFGIARHIFVRNNPITSFLWRARSLSPDTAPDWLLRLSISSFDGWMA
jgi:hypothetical protein